MTAALQVAAEPSLHVERFGADDASTTLVLLHGFGFSGRLWRDLIERLGGDYRLIVPDLPGFGLSAGVESEEDFLTRLEPALPERAIYLGWSLGAALAVALAAKWPRRVEALALLGFNPRFEATGDWPWGMPPPELENFIAVAAAGHWPRTARRLLALCAAGEENAVELRHDLRAAVSPAVSAASAAAGLGFLRRSDARATLESLPMPQLCIQGERDALAPASIATHLRRISGRRRVAILRGSSHAGFLRRGAVIAGLVRGFVEDVRNSKPTPLRRARVARAFDRASVGYDAAAGLQRDAGRQLLTMLRFAAPPPDGVWLDLGCGTGAALKDLRACAGEGLLLAADIAPGMLRMAQDKALCVGADAEALPLSDACVDVIFSNLMFQWSDSPSTLLARLHRVLRPGGWLFFSTFIADSLWQTRAVWRSVDSSVHVHRFADAALWRAAAMAADFEWQRLSVEDRRESHADVDGLFGSLRRLGAVNGASAAAAGLMTPGRWRRMRASYENLREPEGLPLRWQLLYAALRKPA